MQNDPVVAEIRRIREELAARFNYDIHAIFEYVRQRDAADNRKVIRLPPRRTADVAIQLRESTGIAADPS
jgi:hypothetical protein